MPSLAITWAKRLKRVFHIDIAYRDVGKGREQDAVASKPAVNAAVRLKSSPVFDYTDNGMDPLHFLTGLIRAKMEFHINHLEMEWINNEDYNNWP